MNNPITYKDTLIAIGGMYRCCDATINEYIDAHQDEVIEDGLVLDCKYETKRKKSIILEDTVWRWNSAGEEEVP